jgi:hypothetical protein
LTKEGLQLGITFFALNRLFQRTVAASNRRTEGQTLYDISEEKNFGTKRMNLQKVKGFDCISQEVVKKQLMKGAEILLAAYNFFYCIERFFFEITVMHTHIILSKMILHEYF